MLSRFLNIILIALSSFICFDGTCQNMFADWMSTASKKEYQQAGDQLKTFVRSLENTGLSGNALLRKSFHRIHKTFLKQYEPYSNFHEIFSKGKYDCLTATALFSTVLTDLKFSYEVIETNYHIFLIVKTSEGEVLLETTDRFGGFVTSDQEIAKRLGSYHQNILASTTKEDRRYRFSFNLFQKISPENITGLLYFNQAVVAYNKHDWVISTELLEKSDLLYDSPRCKELGAILIQAIRYSTLDEITRQSCLDKLKKFSTQEIFASN